MNKTILTVLALISCLSARDSFAFGRKKMQISELKGITEAQVANIDGVANIMVRGKVAELVYRSLDYQRLEQPDSEAIKILGNDGGTHYSVRGKQISCSKITKIFSSKRLQADYACTLEVDPLGKVVAGREAFNPSTFNLAQTATGSKIFNKSQNRSIASVVPTKTSYSKGHAYLVYENPGEQRKSEEALIVFRGESAKEILTMLKKGPAGKIASWGSTGGRKGQEIACVEATKKEPARCAIVISFKDGSITRTGNPLFY